MTQDEIIEMAREAGLCYQVGVFPDWIDAGPSKEEIIAFAKLVAKHTLSNIDPSKLMSCQEVMEAARLAERQRIVNLLMIQHEAAKDSHNYWHVAANLIQAEAGEQT